MSVKEVFKRARLVAEKSRRGRAKKLGASILTFVAESPPRLIGLVGGMAAGKTSAAMALWARGWMVRAVGSGVRSEAAVHIPDAASGVVIDDGADNKRVAAAIRKAGGIIVEIVRVPNGIAKSVFASSDVDFVLINSGTIDDLHAKVRFIAGIRG